MSGAGRAPDLAIVGAGPAGMGAAIEARKAGMSVTVIDDQAAPGGQIWRAAGSVPARRAALLGVEYVEGRAVVEAFLASGADYAPESVVWNIEAEPALALDVAGPKGGFRLRPRRLLLAAGAVERPTPIPGWTLPGAMSAGALQILLKTSGLVAEGAVLAGSGPLLWLLAAQMAEVGAPPRAVVECAPWRRYLGATALLPGALRGAGPLAKGMKLIAQVRRAGVKVYRGASALRVEGETEACSLRFRDGFGRRRRVEATVIALHTGIVPNQQATRLLRLPHDWSAAQAAFLPRRGADLSVAPGVFAAGDGARIGGAQAALLEGRIAARVMAGLDVADEQRALDKALAARPFLDHLFAPPAEALAPADDTLVCRCEAVRAGEIRRAAREGALGPNQAKFLLRAGMGPCQGRVCGLAVSQIIASETGKTLDETGYFRIRPPLKPLPLSLIAAAETDPS